MTIRNFDAVFSPTAIALVGASNQVGSVGAALARNLFEAGFPGPVMAVNPHERAIHSTLNYRSIDELPQVPDLAVIATPAEAVPAVIDQLGRRGGRAALVITAGFEGDLPESRDLRDRMLRAARPHLLRILGPNSLGLISTKRGINASFAHRMPAAGQLAVVSQSGAIAAAMLDWAAARDVGFSHVVSLGDAADIDFGDMLDYLALDAETGAILLYVEQISDARKFMSAGRIASRSKPVIVIKAGRSAAGARAAFSHTGALAGTSMVYSAAFRRAGMLEVESISDLFFAADILSRGAPLEGGRLQILTNGGGLGVLAADAAEAAGFEIRTLGDETLSRLDRELPRTWSRANPVDMLGDADQGRYRRAMECLLADPDKDAILVMNCPTAVGDSIEAAKGVVAASASDTTRTPIFACWTSAGLQGAARSAFTAVGIPCFASPDESIRAMGFGLRYSHLQRQLLQVPPAKGGRSFDETEIRRIIAAAIGEGRNTLTELESKAVLAAAGIPVVRTIHAKDVDTAGKVALSLGERIALKIHSQDISHKSDLGGVRLNLRPDEVPSAAEELMQRVARAAPAARLEGFVVEEMINRPAAQELICGILNDPVFGPVVLVGHGGVEVEVIKDRVVGLPPIDQVLARDMISRTSVSKLLAGFRDRPPADLRAVAEVLVQLSELSIRIQEISELDINPLLCDSVGVVALDARIGLSKDARTPAIRPYPDGLAGSVVTPGGLKIRLRPVRPEDAHELKGVIDHCEAEERHFGFLAVPAATVPALANRLTQIDYDREMVFVAMSDVNAVDELAGLARLICDPEREKAEFSVFVRRGLRRRGVGTILIGKLVEYARSIGVTVVSGRAPRDDQSTLAMLRRLGFSCVPQADDSRMTVASLSLRRRDEG